MQELVRMLEQHLGTGVNRLVPLAGGDINRAFRAELRDGQSLFVKTNANAPAGMFHREAEGLQWLAEAAVVRVPRVMAVLDEPPALVLEHVEVSRRMRPEPEALGSQLAALHLTGAPRLGELPDNYIGTLHQANATCDKWVDFWIQRRLEPQFELARKTGRAPEVWTRRAGALYEVVRAVIEEPERPERLHGDLWAGNVLALEGGNPVLVDPAAYAGHGEVDLAMMRLFGGFEERVFDAYWYARGGGAGCKRRLLAYQLYPLLVHVNLFGGAYVSQASDAIDRLVGPRRAT